MYACPWLCVHVYVHTSVYTPIDLCPYYYLYLLMDIASGDQVSCHTPVTHHLIVLFSVSVRERASDTCLYCPSIVNGRRDHGPLARLKVHKKHIL